MMTHEQASELLAVFVLDAVEPDEYEQIEAHLSQCPRCRAEVDGHREVAAALGNSVEPLPEGLWSTIAGRLPARRDDDPPPMPILLREAMGADEPGAPKFRSPRPSRPPRSSRVRMGVAASIAVAAAVVAVVLGVNLAHDDNQISQLQSAVGHSAHSAVLAALATPGHKVVNVASTDHVRLAQFVVVPDGRGYLVTSHLPALPSRQTYQLWGVSDGRSISLGLLGPRPRQATFTSAGSRVPTTLAITVEPAGGSVYPSAPPLASGTV